MSKATIKHASKPLSAPHSPASSSYVKTQCLFKRRKLEKKDRGMMPQWLPTRPGIKYGFFDHLFFYKWLQSYFIPQLCQAMRNHRYPQLCSATNFTKNKTFLVCLFFCSASERLHTPAVPQWGADLQGLSALIYHIKSWKSKPQQDFNLGSSTLLLFYLKAGGPSKGWRSEDARSAAVLWHWTVVFTRVHHEKCSFLISISRRDSKKRHTFQW